MLLILLNKMEFNIENPWWKLAIVLGLLGMREFVRLLSPREADNETSKWLIETLDSATIAIGLVLFVIQPFILQAFFHSFGLDGRYLAHLRPVIWFRV